MLVRLCVLMQEGSKVVGSDGERDTMGGEKIQRPLTESGLQLRGVVDLVKCAAHIKKNCANDRPLLLTKNCKRLRPFAGFILIKRGDFVNMTNAKE